MVSVSFWSMAKKRNSTKRPVGSGTTYDCVLKDNTSVLRPQIELDLGPSSNPASWNVCYIQDFGRYYFCSWTFDHGRWIASCEVDTLATYKPTIGAAEMMVLRSSAAYDEYLVDTFYPASSQVSSTVAQVSSPFSAATFNSGTVVMALIGEDTPPLIAFPYSALKDFWHSLFYYAANQHWGSDNYGNITQFIKNIFWLPIPFNSFPGSTFGELSLTGLKIGNVDVDLIEGWIKWDEVKVFDAASTYSLTRTFPLLEHPQTDTKGKYLNSSAFTQHVITIPAVGAFNVPNDVSIDAFNVTAEFEIDLSTGQTIITFAATYAAEEGQSPISRKYLTTTANVSVPVMVGSAQANMAAEVNSSLGFGSSLLTMGVSAVTGNVPGMISAGLGIAGSIQSMQNAWQPLSYSIGSVGSLGALNKHCFIKSTFKLITDTNWSDHGRPLYKNKVLSTIPGFIQTGDSEIELNATQEERETVGSYLTSGFFYE